MAKLGRPGQPTVNRPAKFRSFNDPMVSSANSAKAAEAYRTLVSRSCQVAGKKPSEMFPGKMVCAFCGADHG